MSLDLQPERSLAPFFQNQTLERVISRVSSGKEATVYCCESGSRLGKGRLVAAKIYRPPERRAFKRHMDYSDGRYVRGRTARAALKARKGFGRRLLFEKWIAFEHQVLGRLYRAGVSVPRPIAVGGYCILMDYLGDRNAPAPHLRNVVFGRGEGPLVVQDILTDIETMLSLNLIHGDLSAYNVLYWEGRHWIIDVPQALDPRVNHCAAQILDRDVTRIAEWAQSIGVTTDPHSLSTDLWIRWLQGEL